MRARIDYLSKIRRPTDSDSEECSTRDGPCDRTHRICIPVRDHDSSLGSLAGVDRNRDSGKLNSRPMEDRDQRAETTLGRRKRELRLRVRLGAWEAFGYRQASDPPVPEPNDYRCLWGIIKQHLPTGAARRQHDVTPAALTHGNHLFELPVTRRDCGTECDGLGAGGVKSDDIQPQEDCPSARPYSCGHVMMLPVEPPTQRILSRANQRAILVV